ncbi:neurotrimin-like [Dendronephthya gigantea]|uniref:neurotrimin-like n=1 Tax=Dendronephthya gigantea TaxID=151771 RepID=UPI00106A20FC|nr:neurotrimin-like [Dendronephthya gigantea]
MARLFHGKISLLFPFIICSIPAAVLALSSSDYRVQTETVGSDVEIPCISDDSCLSTMLRYSSAPNLSERTLLMHRFKGQGFKIYESYKGRVALHNSTKVILQNVRVNDSGFYVCNVYFKNGSDDIYRIHLKIGVAPKIKPLKDIAVLEKSSVKVACDVQGQPSPNVSWIHAGLSQYRLIARSYLLKLKHVATSQSGEYICLAENYMGVAEGFLRINVYEKPRIQEFFHNGSLDGVVWQYQDLKLQCEVARNHVLPIQSYKLYRNGKLMMKQSNTGVFLISSVRLQDSGNYTCVPETDLGHGVNKSLRLYVKAQSEQFKGDLTSTSDTLNRRVVTVSPVTFDTWKNASADGGSAECHGSHLLLTFLWFFLANLLILH